MLEDDKVHPYRWLKPDLVAPAPFLLLMVVGFFLILVVSTSSFVMLGFPSFVVLVVVPLILLFSIGRLVVGSLVQTSSIYLLLLGPDLYYVVQHKRASARFWTVGSGEISRLFPEAWFDWLAVVLSGVELDGVWPDGLLDASVTMIPKSDGDATLLGQRPLCVLPVVYRIWAFLFGFVTWIVGFGLGFLFLFLALLVVVGLLMLGILLLWTLRRSCLA